ncbi:MAG: hypothetical protein J6R46_04680 [Clostridia bacterium]|nr:hypothetical protein [Clostridia bacterium]
MKNLTKIFAALLSLCAITSLLLLGAHAFGETEPIDEVEGETQAWVYDQTENVLTHGDTVYEEYFMPSGWGLISNEYRYGNKVKIHDPVTPSEKTVFIHQIMPDFQAPEVYRDIAIMYDTHERIFVTEQGRAAMDAFVNGEYGGYLLKKSQASHLSAIDEEYLIDLADRQPDLTLDVRTLRSANEYLVYGMDPTGSFVHPIGAIYNTVDGHGYVYVHFDGLGNNYLTDDGTLSFRGGEVPAYTVNKVTVNNIVRNGTRVGGFMVATKSNFEDRVDMDQTPALIIFAVMMSPFLYIAPLLLLTLGIVLRSIKKVPSRKRWNSLIILSVLWLLCSLAITALCIAATLI